MDSRFTVSRNGGYGHHPFQEAFTLVELITSIGLLGILLLVLTSMTDSAGRAWTQGQSRIDTFQSARTALEIMGRELTPAVVDTRMQFVHTPATLLQEHAATNVAPNSPALLWMAPLGENGTLTCVGYYLTQDSTRRFYRLKRILVGDVKPSDPRARYFPKMINLADPQDPTLRTSAVNAEWFVRNWDQKAFDEERAGNEAAIVSTAADGVIALWVRAIDVLGNPVPLVSKATNHPKSALYYNSAAYMQMATSKPFDKGASTIYLAESTESLKANRVPAAVDLAIVTLDGVTLKRDLKLPPQRNVLDKDNALDLDACIRDFETALKENGIYNARTFTSRVKLVNGK